MPIKSEIIADSLNSVGNRLTTFILEYPRYIHSEVCTHRVFSKNAASSRAIPIEKMIQQVLDNPAMPEHWGKNQAGMSANEELSDVTVAIEHDGGLGGTQCSWTEHISPREQAKRIWLKARDKAVASVRQLNELGLHKQIANIILEPWHHIRIIMSGTEFENFFALRAHKDAHPDFQKLAYMMLEQYNASKPKVLSVGSWHIPFGDKVDNLKLKNTLRSSGILKENEIFTFPKFEEYSIKIAIARCARISYFNYEGKDDYEADIKLCDRLFGNNPKHLSPTEHVAQALGTSEWSGNFRGFRQYRKMFPEENLSDSRVKKYNNP